MTLRLLSLSDLDAYYEMTNTPTIGDVISFLSYPVDKGFLQDWILRNEGGQDKIYGIFLDGKIAGQIGAHLSGGDGVELGYWVNDHFTGKGIASNALDLLISSIQNHIRNTIVFAECLPDNQASRRVLKKCGFIPTGEQGHRHNRERFILPVV